MAWTKHSRVKVDSISDSGGSARRPNATEHLEAQHLRKPWKRCQLEEFACRTPEASAAKIKSIVDRAAAFAAEENRRIEEARFAARIGRGRRP
jgi:hypothetical protein